MPVLFVFLLKVNVALIVFCLGYFLVLRKLTFYTLNRFYLVLGIIFSSVYPFINLERFMEQHRQLAPIQQAVLNLKAPAQNLAVQAWYWNWALMIFWIGSAFFALRLLTQFISLYKIYRSSAPDELQQYNVRITDADVSPFSFWQTIFINPQNIETADLKSILQHEQVHVDEWHTLDILLAEISLVFYWFNPGIWFMKKAVSENIEFITDRKILQNGTDSKAYQYSLLNVSIGCSASPNIVNHFNFSTLKKRIQMMNARRSSNMNLSRYALLVPTMMICLCIFSVSKADIVHTGKVAYDVISTKIVEMSGGTIAEVSIKAKRNKPRKFSVKATDTTKEIGFRLSTTRADSITGKRQTFEIKSVPGNPKVYTINEQPVSEKEFGFRIKRSKWDTTKEVKFIKVNNKAANIDDVKEVKDIKTVIIKDRKNTTDTAKAIKTIFINSVKAAPTQVKSIRTSTIQKIQIVDSKDTSAASKNNIIKIETKKQ